MNERMAGLRRNVAAAHCDGFVGLSSAANQYLTGFTGSTSAVVATETEAVFLCDFRYTEQARQQVADGWAVEEVSGALDTAAGQRLSDLGAKAAAFDPAVTTVAERDRLEAAFDGACTPAPDVVASLRRIKSTEEVARIQSAMELTEGVLADAVDRLEVGMKEREAAAWIECEFKTRGASGAAFDTVVLFGPRTSMVHGAPNETALGLGDIVLIDLGCRLEGYCSDLTRTFAFGTIPGQWFEEAYALTLTAQQLALEAIRPGMPCRALDAVARDLIAESGHGMHFGHGLGHSVGIDVHEEPRVNERSQAVLEEGMVITVEPGIYLPGRGGVRIEDLVVVTHDGCTCLSRTSKELRVIDG